MKRICVFCGSNSGSLPEYREAARLLGRALARRKIGLVYGGGSVGLMGELADAVLEAGGEVTGVIPRFLMTRELSHAGLTDVRIVSSMHERKALMEELSDGFMAIPGGLGTLEEFFEILTWAQLGIHRKPCGLLNTGSYYDRLIDFLDLAVERQFMEPRHRTMIMVDDNPEVLLDRFGSYLAPEADSRLDLGRT